MPTLADVLAEPGAFAAMGDAATAPTVSSESFDRLSRLGATLLAAPVAAITLVDGREQRLVGAAGVDRSSLEPSGRSGLIGLCPHVAAGGTPIFVDDRHRHPDLRELWRATDAGLVAYAGVPLVGLDRELLGTLAVADRRRRAWRESERAVLADLGLVVVAEIERRVEYTRYARATVALRRSESSLRVLYEQVAVGIGVTDVEGHFVQANPFLCEMLGYREDEFLTLTREDVTHPDERAAMVESDARLLAGDSRSYLVEKRFLRKDRSVAWGRAKISAVRDESGVPQRFVTIVEDISERKRAEAERQHAAHRLEVSEELHRSLFDHHPDAVVLLDPEGRLVSANPACEETMGYSHEELVGRTFAHLVAAEDLEATAAHFRAALEGAAQSYEIGIQHRTGRRVELGVTNIPVKVGGEVIGVFGIARDLTVQRALESKLRHAQKMEAVGRLAGGVAHDFNNVLTIIQSYGELIASVLPADSAVREDLAEILRATDRGAALTRQLLAFGRKQVLQPRVLDLNEELVDLASLLRRLLGAEVSLETQLAPDLWAVHVDAGQLEQVLMNLVVNARDAMPEGGTLTLRTANVEESDLPVAAAASGAARQYVALVVEDTGVGIEAAVLPHLFEPFFTTKDPGKGTGLGLPTVYSIVDRSGGRVSVESTPGRGTRFTVLLPRAVADAGATPSEAAPSVPLPTGSETVLLVEDESPVRIAIRRLLERQGYTVMQATNGYEALDVWRARGESIDLLLTDVAMPGLGGLPLVERLRAERPDLRVIIMTGYAEDVAVTRVALPPGAAFLQKPIASDVLLRNVREVLDRGTG